MSRNTEPHLKAESALRQVLSVQKDLLSREDSQRFADVCLELSKLAANTLTLIQEHDYSKKSINRLLHAASGLERAVDDISEEIWKSIDFDLAIFFERIRMDAFPVSAEQSTWSDVRSHYNSHRVALLQQAFGARMLDSNSDLGEEVERILQQYLERNLGPSFRILRGGKIRSRGGDFSAQIDVIVVSADSPIFTPSSASNGKSYVFVEHVISAFMVTSTLSKRKLEGDWRNLQSIPLFDDYANDFPELEGHFWPLCYIFSAQSHPLIGLSEKLQELSSSEGIRHHPQFIVTLDNGFIYSGARRWPAPRYPSNYKEPDQIRIEEGKFCGLGLAWILAQQRGRLAVIQRQNLSPIKREKSLLDSASMSSVTDSFSPRKLGGWGFRKISDNLRWGGTGYVIHNKLQVWTIELENQEPPMAFFANAVEAKPYSQGEKSDLRYFRADLTCSSGNLVALEEWSDFRSKDTATKKIVVFDNETAREIKEDRFASMTSIFDIESVLSRG